MNLIIQSENLKIMSINNQKKFHVKIIEMLTNCVSGRERCTACTPLSRQRSQIVSWRSSFFSNSSLWSSYLKNEIDHYILYVCARLSFKRIFIINFSCKNRILTKYVNASWNRKTCTWLRKTCHSWRMSFIDRWLFLHICYVEIEIQKQMNYRSISEIYKTNYRFLFAAHHGFSLPT